MKHGFIAAHQETICQEMAGLRGLNACRAHPAASKHEPFADWPKQQ